MRTAPPRIRRRFPRPARTSALLVISSLPTALWVASSCGITTDGDVDGAGGGFGDDHGMMSSTDESVSSQSSQSATTEAATTDADTSSASTTAAATSGGFGGFGN